MCGSVKRKSLTVLRSTSDFSWQIWHKNIPADPAATLCCRCASQNSKFVLVQKRPRHWAHAAPFATPTHATPTGFSHTTPTHFAHATPTGSSHTTPTHFAHATPTGSSHTTPTHFAHATPTGSSHTTPTHFAHATPTGSSHTTPTHFAHATPTGSSHTTPTHFAHATPFSRARNMMSAKTLMCAKLAALLSMGMSNSRLFLRHSHAWRNLITVNVKLNATITHVICRWQYEAKTWSWPDQKTPSAC